jgi:SAM-dependent methyltransferase
VANFVDASAERDQGCAVPASSLARARTPFWSSHLGALFPGLVTSGVWDREYARGSWDHLSSSDELARYLIVMGRVLSFGASCRVLDVGCGTGRLLELLRNVSFGSYVGLDLSGEAVERAQQLAVPNSRFQVSDAGSFQSDEQFDIFLFYDVLY